MRLQITKNISAGFFNEWLGENFSIIEISRKVLHFAPVQKEAEMFNIVLLGFGIGILFADHKLLKVEEKEIKKIPIKDMDSPLHKESPSQGTSRGEKTGDGIIKLETYKHEEDYTTYLKYDFQNLNTEGAISELKKLVKKLEKDL